MLVDNKKLAFYIKQNLNVLFEGERGVGKTSIIYKSFEEQNLKVKYFSAPTMDPWTDLVGVPTTITREDGKEVLRMIPPEDFVDDKYDVIFIDELNRAPPKVLNALMELIQFKTINGKPYNIKMIWAAINPYSDEQDYTVEPLDIALKDRFHIQYKFPYKTDKDFFKKTYGQIGATFCEWWDNQPNDVKKEISPRRLFDTVSFYQAGGDIADMLNCGNIEKLKSDVKNVSVISILEKDFNEKIISDSKSVLLKNYPKIVKDYLLSNKKIFNFFFNELDNEWLSKEFINKSQVFSYVLDLAKNEKNTKALEIVSNIVELSPLFVKINFEEFKEFKDVLPETLQEEIIASKSKLDDFHLISSNQVINKAIFRHTRIKDVLFTVKPRVDGSIANLTISALKKHIGNNKSEIYSFQDKLNLMFKNDKNQMKEIKEINEIKDIFSNYCAYAISYYKAQEKERIGEIHLNNSAKNFIDMILNKNSKYYAWRFNFQDMGEIISNKLLAFENMNKKDIYDLYEQNVNVKPNKTVFYKKLKNI